MLTSKRNFVTANVNRYNESLVYSLLMPAEVEKRVCRLPVVQKKIPKNPFTSTSIFQQSRQNENPERADAIIYATAPGFR